MISLERINIAHLPIIVFAALLISCIIQSSKEEQTSIPNNDLIGQLFMVAPSIDSIKCIAYGECDCCTSHYLFINKTDFIAVAYCLESDTYFKGTYNCHSNKIDLFTSGRYVDKEYPGEDETDSKKNDTVNFNLTSNNGDPIKIEWIRFDCKNGKSFKTVEKEPQYVTIDSDIEFGELIKEIKQEGIWASLGLE